ncbi:MAG: TIGR00303 family protein [Chloroflexi bacterium]|nr:TIGR00303 family protein [Chloroflexota bacterium]
MTDRSQPISPTAAPQTVRYLHEEARGRALVEQLRGRTPRFACVIGYTAICELPGISSAGLSEDLRRFTAAADVEVLHHGRPRCLAAVPANPLGPPSPVVITATALRLLGISCEVIDAGAAVRPDCPHTRLVEAVGGDIRGGRAVPHARELFEKGLELGARLADRSEYLVIGESVPGGTTTALALMLALGLNARGKVSSSSNRNPHSLKETVVDEALRTAWPDGMLRGLDPLAAAAAVGDPMQPTVAGLVLGAAGRCPVVLAGGTQMASVLALASAIARRQDRGLDPGDVAVCTTRWVAEDPSADLLDLARQIGSYPFLCSTMSFAEARQGGLRRYEEGLVKEGVGAGGAAVAATLALGIDNQTLLAAIDAFCDELFGAAPA